MVPRGHSDHGTSAYARLNSMTNPGGDSGQIRQHPTRVQARSEPTSGGYEAPSIEQSQQHGEQSQPQPATEQFTPPAAPTEQFTPPASCRRPPRSTRRRPAYRPPHGLPAGRLCTTRLPAVAGLSAAAARLSVAGRAATGLSAALPRPVGIRRAAGIRRPVLSPATALRRSARAIRRHRVVSAHRDIPVGTALATAQPQPKPTNGDRSLVASLVGYPVHRRIARRHRARRRRAEPDQGDGARAATGWPSRVSPSASRR